MNPFAPFIGIYKAIFCFCAATFWVIALQAQSITQTIKGRVTDVASGFPLQGVAVSIELKSAEESLIFSAETDADGQYKLSKVPIGRHKVKFSYLGYKPLIINEVQVTSAKEVYLPVTMEEAVQEVGEVTVYSLSKAQTVNDMAIISARSFTVEEADRYAASRQDPARMAGNFAGVNSTSDARNDIVIRGNSPLGLLWRLNDIDIPNPSHFAIAGSTGGPLSIINTKFLARSDFFTGAFAAEYGNANAGVFDLKMRNGNAEKYEFTAQLGILGTELSAEGPFKKGNKSSFLGTFRYSTFELLQGINIRIGTDAVPKYWDWSFRTHFPTKKAGTFSLFGIGGVSNIDIILSTNNERPQELYGDQNRDQYFRTNMGVLGAQHIYFFNSRTYITSTLSQTYQNIYGNHHFIVRDSATYRTVKVYPILGFDQQELRSSLAQNLNHKISNRLTLKAGYMASLIYFSNLDSARFDSASRFTVRGDARAAYALVQPFAQVKYRANEKLTIHAGLRGQVLTLNNSSRSIEPRAGLNYQWKPGHTISLGYGLHSQMQPNYIYFMRTDFSSPETPNRSLGFSRSQHFVAAYDYIMRQDLRFKTEVYYQNLWGIPIYSYPSGISLINQGATFTRFFPNSAMVNKGIGYNYGLEFTVEKFFSKNYYVLWTTSLYESKYKASDNKWRDTDFNGNYITNLLAGYEFPLGKNQKTTLVTGTKITFAGGRLYSPANLDSSFKYLDYYPDENAINTLRFQDYARWDLRLGVRINAQKITHEVIIDLINVLDIRNPLALTFAPDPTDRTKNPIIINYQLGLLPLFYYRVDF